MAHLLERRREPCRILEIISPAGFEQFFRELTGLGPAVRDDPGLAGELSERYGLEVRPETLPELLERFGLRLGEQLTGGWSPPVV